MTEMTMETCTKCGYEFAHDMLYFGLCPWCTPVPETLQLTRDELKALHLMLYGTDFSDINPHLQTAADKIHALASAQRDPVPAECPTAECRDADGCDGSPDKVHVDH